MSALAIAHPGPGIVVDPAGRIYFVDTFEHRIMRIDPDGVLSTFVEDARLRLPHHLVVDSAGNLYTASDFDGRVWKITPEGVMTEFLDSRDLDPGITRVGRGGDPFTLDDAGHVVFVASASQSSGPFSERILIHDPARGTRPFTTTPGRPFDNLHFGSLAWDQRGALYVTDGARIRRVAADGRVSTVTIVDGPAPRSAVGIAIQSDGAIVVADYRGVVLRIDPRGQSTVLARARHVGPPVGIALDQSGNVVVLASSEFGTRVTRIGRAGDRTRLANLPGPAIRLVPFLAVAVALPVLLSVWLASRVPASPTGAVLWSVLVGVLVVLGWVVSARISPGGLSIGADTLRHLPPIVFAASAFRHVRAATRSRDTPTPA